MIKYCEGFQLASMGVSQRSIAESRVCGQSAVSDILKAVAGRRVEG